MKHTKLILSLILFLAACAAPVIVTPTQTPQSFTSTPDLSTPTMTVTPDPQLGSIAGNLSWLNSSTSESIPISHVNFEINGHTGSNSRYTTKADLNGHYRFSNIEPGNYGFGIYLNLQISERLCEDPEYIFSQDLKWLHYATWLKVEVWYDILFSSVDVVVKPGEVTVLDFVLKCP